MSSISAVGGVNVSLCPCIQLAPFCTLEESGQYLFEVRQQPIPTPSRISQLLPSIIISGCSTSKKHAIDHCPTTYHIASVEWSSAIVEAWLRDTGICPDILGWNRQTRNRSSVFLPIAIWTSVIRFKEDEERFTGSHVRLPRH